MMKVYITIFIVLTIPVFSDTGIQKTSISSITSVPALFTEEREPSGDSLYNAFDGDKKTSALFSDFTVQFSSSVEADEISIINGFSEDFMRYDRLKDIEITLYASEIIPAVKKNEKKNRMNKSGDKKGDKDQKNENENNTDKYKGLTANAGLTISGTAIGTVKDVLAEKPVIEKKEEKTASEVQKTSAKKKKLKTIPDKKVNQQESKLTGIIKIEDGENSRIMLYYTLKDIAAEQSIKLGGLYSIKKVSLRGVDYYQTGSDFLHPFITDLKLFKNKKRVIFEGLEPLKKLYKANYISRLTSFISGGIFSIYNDGEEKARVYFREDGRIDCRERFNCAGHNVDDCLVQSIPDKWKIIDGHLYLRHQNEWYRWKYEMRCDSDLMNNNNLPASPDWIKIYYRNNNGFTDRFHFLEKSINRNWKWDY